MLFVLDVRMFFVVSIDQYGYENMSRFDMEILLRPVELDDLPIRFEFQLDAESNQMAFTHPRSKEAIGRMAPSDSPVVVRSVIADEFFAGCISCFKCDGQQHPGYWIVKQLLGKVLQRD
ncbi:MAG: hypothetical protein R3C49_27390 [Planctomycetaceae bacterium]